jgi:hypothetical protein
VTEAELLACSDPEAMLKFLRTSGRASKRKLRLFACACCRSFWPLLRHKRSRKAIEIAEQYADGEATWDKLMAAYSAAKVSFTEIAKKLEPDGASRDAALRVVIFLRPGDGPSWITAARPFCGIPEPQAYAPLLRDIFTNPGRSRSRLNPSILAWNDGTVRKLAQAIYNERRFGDLPILADALEEAGCTNADILAHCRQPGEHVRGCWVVDLLLAKE